MLWTYCSYSLELSYSYFLVLLDFLSPSPRETQSESLFDHWPQMFGVFNAYVIFTMEAADETFLLAGQFIIKLLGVKIVNFFSLCFYGCILFVNFFVTILLFYHSATYVRCFLARLIDHLLTW